MGGRVRQAVVVRGSGLGVWTGGRTCRDRVRERSESGGTGEVARTESRCHDGGSPTGRL